jgi:hypothetical protein
MALTNAFEFRVLEEPAKGFEPTAYYLRNALSQFSRSRPHSRAPENAIFAKVPVREQTGAIVCVGVAVGVVLRLSRRWVQNSGT